MQEIKALVTHDGESPESLIGKLVKVRPYYHVPNGPSSLASVRSPWTQEAHVVETFGTEMVSVVIRGNDGPWKAKQAFYPRELHKTYGVCGCEGCILFGTGIHTHHGA